VDFEPLFSPLDFWGLAIVMALIFFAGWRAGQHQGRSDELKRMSRSLHREVARETRVRL
jgi:hypothetical protein